MAITEATKVEIARVKSQLRAQFDKNQADIEAHQAAIAKLKANNQALKARRDALVADIPKPTPVETE